MHTLFGWIAIAAVAAPAECCGRGLWQLLLCASAAKMPVAELVVVVFVCRRAAAVADSAPAGGSRIPGACSAGEGPG